MLPALMIGAWRAAAAICASSAAVNPVVPMTCTARALAARPANSTVALGEVKSRMPSQREMTSRASEVTGNAERWQAGERRRHLRRWPASPRRSTPPTMVQPAACAARTSSWPIRPATPITATFIRKPRRRTKEVRRDIATHRAKRKGCARNCRHRCTAKHIEGRPTAMWDARTRGCFLKSRAPASSRWVVSRSEAGQSQANPTFFSLARPKRSKPTPTGRPPRRQ